VDGERRDVGGTDDTADRERCSQLIAALLEAVSEQRCRQRRIDESCGDEIDPHRRELKCEGRREWRQRGRGGCRDPEAGTDAPGAGAAHEQQRARRPHLGGGVARDFEPQHCVAADRLAHLGLVHFKQRPVVGTAGRDHHVVDRCWQVLEEPPQGSRIVGVECRGALRAKFERGLLERAGIPAGENDVSALSTGQSSGLKPDARAAADHDDRLSGQLRFPLGGTRRAPAGHDRSDHWRRRPGLLVMRRIPRRWVIDTSAGPRTGKERVHR
jgi:hypothetical protein